MIEFKGTGYFDLQHDEAYLQLVRQGIDLFGLNNPISRLAPEDFTVLEEAESIVATELNCEDACLLSCGYLAGIAVTNCLNRLAIEQRKLIIRANSNHPCLSDLSGQIAVPLSDTLAMQELLDLYSQGTIAGWYSVSNSVNSFYGHVDHAMRSQIAIEADIRLMDVSHSMFLLDHSELQGQANAKPDGRNLFVGSLGKSAAFPAGFVAGSKKIIDLIRCCPEYTAASPPSRSIAFAFVRSQSLRCNKWNHLYILKRCFETELLGCCAGISSLPLYSLGVNCDGLYEKLLAAGFKLSFMPYPMPASDRHLRLVINASHRLDDVKHVARVIREHGVKVCDYGKEFTTWQMTIPKSNNRAR